jgi:hypothetical protein
MDNLKPRWFCQNLRSALRVLPVSVLTGARQTGKTTLARLIEPSRAYFTLDEMGVLDQAQRNPDSLLATRPVTRQCALHLDGGQFRKFRDQCFEAIETLGERAEIPPEVLAGRKDAVARQLDRILQIP